MRNVIRSIGIFLMILAVTVGMVSCAKDNPDTRQPFDKNIVAESLENCVLAENQWFILEWNSEYQLAELVDKSNGRRYSPIPDGANNSDALNEFGLPMTAHPRVNSALVVEYINPQSWNIDFSVSYTSAVQDGRVSAEKIPGGVRSTYYFDEEEISVPVEYLLCEDGLRISVDTTKIRENKNKVYKIVLAPFYCSVSNDAKDGYIFVPSGSGALIYPKTLGLTGQHFSGEVYGADPSVVLRAMPTWDEPIRMPVFGATNGKYAVCGIIEAGAEAALIEAIVGAETYRYTSVFPSFCLRGAMPVIPKKFNSGAAEATVYADKMIDEILTVKYIPLSGEEANYAGMARAYRKYLQENSNLTPRETSDSPLNLRILGGTQAVKSFLGIPYRDLATATTLDQTAAIINEITANTNGNVTVLLKGFSPSGLDVGNIGDSYKISGKLGSVSKLQELARNIRAKGGSLFYDFDLVRSRDSSGAKGVNRQTAYLYNYNIALRDKDKDYGRFKLLARSRLPAAMDTLLKKTAKWNDVGFGFSTLSSIAYSDYSENKTARKGKMGEDVAAMLRKVQQAGRKISVSEANVYAATIADMLFDVPLHSAKNDVFDADVPFYQIVLKGYVPMAGTPANLADDLTKHILATVESGCGLAWSLAADVRSELLYSSSPALCRSEFDGLKSEIIKQINNLQSYYEAINGAIIKNHSILKNGLRETEFDNGITVWVNYTDRELISPNGAVSGRSFLIGGMPGGAKEKENPRS